jgi:hypothetical protein
VDFLVKITKEQPVARALCRRVLVGLVQQETYQIKQKAIVQSKDNFKSGFAS